EETGYTVGRDGGYTGDFAVSGTCGHGGNYREFAPGFCYGLIHGLGKFGKESGRRDGYCGSFGAVGGVDWDCGYRDFRIGDYILERGADLVGGFAREDTAVDVCSGGLRERVGSMAAGEHGGYTGG